MALKTLSTLLAGAGIAAVIYKLGQRPAERHAPSLDADTDTPAAPDPASPNRAERLQDLKLANAGLGSTANFNNEDLLTPPRGDSQQPDVITPGLPDFARGA